MTDKNNGVLVVVEVAESQPVDLGLEMLGLARRLTDGFGWCRHRCCFWCWLRKYR